MQEETMLPCPFCGYEPIYWLDSQYQDRHVIECEDCGCQKRYEYSKEGVIRDWNTRWINPQQQEKETICNIT